MPPRAPFVLIAPTEHEAARLAHGLDGAILLPAWDVGPLANKSPSAVSQAMRLRAIAAIDGAKRPRVVCSALAAAQAVPPGELASRKLRVAPGDDAAGLLGALVALGYRSVDRIALPGDVARYAQATDLWCADRDGPVRLRHVDGTVGSIEPCDPATLRTSGERIEALDVPLCASNPAPANVVEDGSEERVVEDPHGWTLRHERRTLRDLVGGARVLTTGDAVERGAAIVAEIEDEHADRTANGEHVPPRGAWLSAEEWAVLTGDASTVEIAAGDAPMPVGGTHEFAEEPLEAGDLVVHLHHGVGIYRGIETVGMDGDSCDALCVGFADGDVAVPAHEADLVWRYGDRAGRGVALAKIGDDDWTETIAGLIGDLRETAVAIGRVRAERAERDAPAVSWDRGALRVLAADWHTPTPDQAIALTEVREDMDGTAATVRTIDGGVRPPMDRLLCGDTGFGKTEIIVRAAAATVEAGYQAVVAAPTTILADQHGVTFKRRLEPLGMIVRVLTGATPAAERAETLRMLSDGEPMVVIGTHLLAGDDVVPARPGLLVMDEEQRFGAGIKLALRGKEPYAHVLATTATPIPRTTMAALVGLRSISTLRTPPPGRRGVRTEVSDWNAARLRRALKAERAAGGRSFVVVPRIEDMEDVAAGLAKLVPNLSVAMVHGKLDDAGTAERLRAFREGEVDVLLATTVIETGIDVPEANLMVVLDAGRFGVGQLHQLRGRVGRGERRGRALLFEACGWIDCVTGASDRLALLAENDHLGAGFTLAARDLAQRGSGDLFGGEQTGHTLAIGLELYARLMRDALDGRSADFLTGSKAKLHVPDAAIDATYIPHDDVRARLYGRLAKARDVEEIEGIADEMADRFGPLPDRAKRFVAAARSSRRARDHGVRAISASREVIALDLAPERAAALSKLIHGDAITWKGDRVILRSDKPDPKRLDAMLDAFDKADGLSDAGAEDRDERRAA